MSLKYVRTFTLSLGFILPGFILPGFISLGFITMSSGIAHANESTTAAEVWNFQVLLDDDPIGFHKFEITRNQNRIEVHSSAQFDVTFFYIPVYSYQHKAQEQWRDGCLVNINASTDDNGDLFAVRSEQQNEKLLVTTQKSSATLEGCIRSFAYWDLGLLNSSQLLNVQTGEYETVELTDLGDTRFTLDNREIDARHYRLRAKDASIELWYTPQKHWLALESTTSSGAVLRYQPQAGTGAKL